MVRLLSAWEEEEEEAAGLSLRVEKEGEEEEEAAGLSLRVEEVEEARHLMVTVEEGEDRGCWHSEVEVSVGHLEVELEGLNFG